MMNSTATTVVRSKPARLFVADTHAFASGQSVRLKNAFLTTGNVYLITASLPTNGTSPQYRIRSAKENFERMACEADLELLSPSLGADKDGAAEILLPEVKVA